MKVFRPGGLPSASLCELYEASHAVETIADVSQIVDRTAAIMADELGWRSVIIAIRAKDRPDEAMIIGVHGADSARMQLVSTSRPWELWEKLLDDRFARGRAFLVPTTAAAELTRALAPWEPPAGGLALLPMRDQQGALRGAVIVGLDTDGETPPASDLDALMAVTNHLGVMLGGVLETISQEDHSIALHRLLAVSARFVEERDTKVMLETVCHEIRETLGFRDVAVMLPDEAGVLRAVATGGTEVSASERGSLPLELGMEAEHEYFGCYLVPRPHRAGAPATNHEPWTWRHDLIVPLHDREGDLIGQIWADSPEGNRIPAQSRLQALRLFADQAQSALAFARLYEQAHHAAEHDSLTGLPNRSMLLDRLDQSLRRTRRSGRTVAILFVDLDRFKAINDTYGHEAGDEVLRTVARRIETLVRAGDTVSRLGGDEFVVLCHDVEGPADALRVSQRLREVLSAPIRLGSNDISLTSSIGIALPASAGETAQGLIRDADIAMYRAKDAGRDGVEMASAGMRAGASVRADLERAIRSSLSRGQMTVVWQPIVNLGSDSACVHRAEALLRWNHPERGQVSPLEFIPLAEETGMIHELGRWVIGEACAQAGRWRAGYGAAAPGVAVNLSPRQLRDTGIVAEFERQMAANGLPPGSLCAEITEGVLLEGGPTTARVLAQLQAIGVSVELDDFGTGYSSLSSLEQFRVDGLKIDRSFVSGTEHKRRGRAVVEALVMMAHALGLWATAEGIETERQRRWLADLGCDFGQGYLFARPAPATDLEPLFGIARPSLSTT